MVWRFATAAAVGLLASVSMAVRMDQDVHGLATWPNRALHSIARWITDVLSKPDDAAIATRVRGEVLALCQQFPAPTT